MDTYDPDEAVRKVYFEYLADRYRDDQVESLHRQNRFDNGEPHSHDRAAIKNAGEAYNQNFGTGEALNAARDAFYEEKFRHDFIQKNADPGQYSKNSEYRKEWYERGTDFARGQLQEGRQAHQEPEATLAAVHNEGSVDSSTQELVDHTRGIRDEARGKDGLNSTDDLIQHSLNAGKSSQPDNSSSAQELIEYTTEPQLPSPRSNRNDPSRYEVLKNPPSQTPPRFHR